MRILVIAHNTFREAVRDKVLYVLLVFAIITILGSKALGWVSVGQDEKIIKDISLSALSLFGVLISIFIGTNLVYKEIDKRTLYTILCRPLNRYEFILGKFAGLAGLLGVTLAGMTLLSAAYMTILHGFPSSSFFLAAFLAWFELMLVTSFAVLLSTLTSPILGALLSFLMYVFGHATRILIDLPPQFKDTFAEKALRLVYYIVPNLSNFNIRAEAANDMPVDMAYVAWAIGYGIVFTSLFLILAAFSFEEKDV